MLKTVVFLSAVALSGAALAQQSPSDKKAEQEQSAAAGDSSALRCDFMNREEMLMCQATKPGDVSGVRSTWCDSLGSNVIERCLKEQESVSSDPANEFRDRKAAGAGSG
jgi:hypothetical protein